MYETIDNCRACISPNLDEILSFGDMPLADRLLTEEQLKTKEPRFPLTVLFCNECSLVQLRETVDPEILYCEDYPYYSSFLDSWVQHCRENALELIASRGLNQSSLVVEIACNDGYMLKNFVEKGIPVLGIDPAAGPARAAEESGIPVINDFFTSKLALQLKQENRQADLVLGNNVLAHVADLGGFVDGIRTVLKPEGMAVIEAPYVRDLIEGCEFDTIYHEHHGYFSVTALSKLFARHGLSLNNVRRLGTHGGSIRVFIGHNPAPTVDLFRLLEEERSIGLDTFEYYQSFGERVRTVQKSLAKMVGDLKKSGKTIAAYAASAKGATLLNSTDIGSEALEYVVDRNRHKHGKYMPGVHLPIYDTSRLLATRPDYVLLLAWNHKEEIFRQQSEYREQGGRFIVPIPKPKMV